jgi:hypothetical protein
MLVARLLEVVRSALNDLFSETEAPRSDLDRIEAALAGLDADLVELRTRQSLAWGAWQSALAQAHILDQKLQIALGTGAGDDIERILSQQRAAMALAGKRRKDFQDLASLAELLQAEIRESQGRLETLHNQRLAIVGAQQASALLEALARLHQDLRRQAWGDAYEQELQHDRVERLADHLTALQELESNRQAKPGADTGQGRSRGKRI